MLPGWGGWHNVPLLSETWLFKSSVLLVCCWCCRNCLLPLIHRWFFLTWWHWIICLKSYRLNGEGWVLLSKPLSSLQERRRKEIQKCLTISYSWTEVQVAKTPALCFLGQREDSFCNPGANPEASLEWKELNFLVNQWQKERGKKNTKLWISFSPLLPFETFQRCTQAKWYSIKRWSLSSE